LLDVHPRIGHDGAMQIGLGLWTMRSTAAFPASWPALYGQLRDDARLAEALGYHSLWIAEHHFWYDGWCCDPLTAAASALAATSTLHVGTGVHLLPLYDRDAAVSRLCDLQRLFDGRLEHGVGLGYRASEYDGYGRSRRVRGKRMDSALQELAALGEHVPRIWVGGFARPAVERAGRLGLGLMLPSTLRHEQLRATIETARAASEKSGHSIRIGVMKYAWPTDGTSGDQAWATDLLDGFTREYSGAWFALKGRPAFEAPELLDAQMRRSTETAWIGPTEQLRRELEQLAAEGVELCVLHLIGDGRLPERHRAMHRIADEVLPAVRDAAAPTS
jgi:alkanesulfonate monooxygenase SsuD/methylene tetrahydromethanopterin reductase-like flavin-dependent oxidoreductase (luciferase family)